jgi:hypothetical protein
MFRRTPAKKSTPSASQSTDLAGSFEYPATALNPRFREFFDYWKSKSVNGRLPGRQDIDPLEMRRFLPHLMLLDVVREHADIRFRFRLFGTGLLTLWKADFTGLWLDEVLPRAGYRDVHTDLLDIVSARQPRHGMRRLVFPGRDMITHERLMLPLASDGESVDLLMGLFFEAQIPPT